MRQKKAPMWHCNPLRTGIFSHVLTACSFSNTSNYCLKRSVSLWTEVGRVTYRSGWYGREGLGGVCGTILSLIKNPFDSPKNLSVCAVCVCHGDWRLSLWLNHTSGESGGGGEGRRRRKQRQALDTIYHVSRLWPAEIFAVLLTSLPVTGQQKSTMTMIMKPMINMNLNLINRLFHQYVTFHICVSNHLSITRCL